MIKSEKTIAANLECLAVKKSVAKTKAKTKKRQDSKVLVGRKKSPTGIPTKIVRSLPILHRYIDKDTPIVPMIVAETVAREACSAVGSNVPLKYITDLADKAHKTYNAKDGKFATAIRSRGNKGRDHLYAFMRHWLSAMLKKDHEKLFNKLPRGFSNGEPSDEENKLPDTDK